MIPALDPSACLGSGWQVTPDLPLRLLVVSGLMGVAGWSDAQRYFPGKRAFFWLNAVLAGWIVGTSAEHAAAAAACKATVALISWPLILLQPPLWALFLHQYVNSETRAPPARRWVPALGVYLLLALLALSNGEHGLFYGAGSELGPAISGLPRMRYERGPAFLLAATWGYGWLVAATVVILRAVRDCAPEDRHQWITFLVMMLVPWATNIAYLAWGVRLLGADPTPLSFAIAVVGFGWLIRNSSLLRVVPMSRRLLFTALPDPVLVLDSLDRVIDSNLAGQRLAGREMARGRFLAEWPVFGAGLADLLKRNAGAECTLVMDEPPLVLDVRIRDIGEGARRIGRLLQLRDVTERHRAQARLANALVQRDAQLQQVAQLEAELREQTLRDPLTGLLNRRALQQRFDQERQHQLATGQSLTLVLLDIDHFKRINDEFGHAAGDAVLQTLGRMMAEGLRASDAVFRIGGEEFALLLPNADARQAMHRVQALRERATAPRQFEPDRAVTFSAGIATCHDGTTSLDDLIPGQRFT